MIMTEEKVGGISTKGEKDLFFERLQEASTELGSVKSSFSKGMEDLAKIETMLNFDGLSKMDSMIRSFEDRLADSERRREEAVEGARRYSVELEKEKERLVKLWDAYKNQEDSLAAQERKVVELDERLRDSERIRMQFENDATARIQTLTQKLEEQQIDARQVDDLKQQVMRFDDIRTQLETNIDQMRGDLIVKDDFIRSLEKQVDELRGFEQFAGFKTKFEEVSVEYEKEKERLTKLFRLFEETESENKMLKEELSGWRNWFDSNEDLFTKLFSSVEHLRRHEAAESTTSTTDDDIVIPSSLHEQSEHERPKRKLLFRK
jgi:chromosome segregation ATPase